MTSIKLKGEVAYIYNTEVCNNFCVRILRTTETKNGLFHQYVHTKSSRGRGSFV